ncbi:MAG: class I SAM-dependent methyltransferase [Deltaproteobacteria bacterium]|nr:class I SAM-dependent methyltransferase [Candidatus Zymogenaceae bacterium]
MDISRYIINSLLTGSPMPIEIVYWDGTVSQYGNGCPQHRVTFKSAAAVRRLLTGISLGFGEGYMNGEIEVEGDLQQLLSLPSQFGSGNGRLSFFTALSEWAASFRNRNALSGSRKNVSHHYDISNDFYRLWLDHNLQYTCSYFTDPSVDLNSSQLKKMDYICKKADLKEGQTVIETGCGWGGLAVYAAKRYGVHVTAYNISGEQISYARRLADEAEVGDRVCFLDADYRNAEGSYDRFISIGMLEHVGKENYRTFVDVIKRTLKKGGRGVIHFIGKVTPKKGDAWVAKYIFPGGYSPALSEVLIPFEKTGLNVRDVENLRLHYAQTLDHWARQFENEIDTIRETFDERFIRMWRFYLNCSSAGFKWGGLALYQIIFTNGLDNTEELTREYLYSNKPDRAQWNFLM